MKGLLIALACLLALMAFALLGLPDRTVGLTNRLVKDHQLYVLDPAERRSLTQFLTALAAENHVTTPININAPYRRGALNVYVTDPDVPNAVQLTRGNAAYVGKSDILLIDGSYFRLGDKKVLTPMSDALDAEVTAPVRLMAYVVLAHEFGHRQLHRHLPAWRAGGEDYDEAHETQADAFAVHNLEALYKDDATRTAAALPPPSTSLLGVFGDPTPLDRFTDHLTNAVAFSSTNVFEAPFPILSHGRAHPPFYQRLEKVLDILRKEAVDRNDKDASDKLALAAKLTAASTYLLALKPVEIELSHPFQYAFLDDDTLYVVGNDGLPIATRKLAELKAGEQTPLAMGPPQRLASIRYAWPGPANRTLELRRDDNLVLVEDGSGAEVGRWPLKGQLGDISCAKQFILPPQPSGVVYFTFCIAGGVQGGVVDKEGRLTPVDLAGQAHAALAKAGTSPDGAAPTIVQVDLTAAGAPFIIFEVEGALYSAALDAQLHAQVPAKRLSADMSAEDLIDEGPLHYRPKTFLLDQSGHAWRLEGDYLSRTVNLVDAEAPKPPSPLDVDLDTEPLGPGFGPTPFAIGQAFQLQEDRIVVNLEQGGAYLVDFKRRTVAPISRDSWRSNEQITSNRRGDWLYYQKYGSRILVFKRG